MHFLTVLLVKNFLGGLVKLESDLRVFLDFCAEKKYILSAQNLRFESR